LRPRTVTSFAASHPDTTSAEGQLSARHGRNIAALVGMRLPLLAALVCLSCAAPPRRADPNPGTAPAPAPVATAPAAGRIKDSVPERRAALNDADRDLQSEAGEQQWGLDEARKRRDDARHGDAGTTDAALMDPASSAAASGSLIPSPPH
jgi:hypothetical protein